MKRELRVARYDVKQSKYNWWPFLIIVLASVIVMMPQIISGQMIVGDDAWFHMNRAYDTMMQLKTGHLSYFLDLYGFNRSGRIVTGLYGPMGSYLEGLLLLIVKTWYRWEIVNSLAVLIISGLSVYYVARKLGSQWIPGILAGIMYMLSFPFERWVINQNFDGFGAILMPWFLLAGYRLYTRHFSPVKLALLVTVAAQIHIMSTFVGLISLLISFGMANAKPRRLQLWKQAAEAAGVCVLLTINVWGALLEVKSSNQLVPTFPYHHMLSPLHVINVHMLLQPGAFTIESESILLLGIGIALLVYRHFNSVATFLTVQALAFMWLASKYFPWAHLLQSHAMLSSYIQFPERFLPLAIAAIVLMVARLKPWWLGACILLIPILINVNVGRQNEQAQITGRYQKTVLSSFNVMMNHHDSPRFVDGLFQTRDTGRFLKAANNRVPDYMPFAVNIHSPKMYYRLRPDKQNIKHVIYNRLPIRRLVTGRNTAKLTFNVRPGQKVDVPFVKYAHTRVWLNHQPIRPQLNQLQTVELRPTQRHNVLQAQYQPSQWYRCLTLVEVLAWLMVLIWIALIIVRRP